MSEEEEMAQCPYNISHTVLKSRMAVHLIKCRMQNPVAVFETCSFNSTHHVPKPEIQCHAKDCPDQKETDNLSYMDNVNSEDKNKDTMQFYTPVTENWDEGSSGSFYSNKENKKTKMLFLEPKGMSKTKRKEFTKMQELTFQQISLKKSNSES